MGNESEKNVNRFIHYTRPVGIHHNIGNELMNNDQCAIK